MAPEATYKTQQYSGEREGKKKKKEGKKPLTD